jgi:hypothetical protein
VKSGLTALMMEAASISETSVYQTSRRSNTEESSSKRFCVLRFCTITDKKLVTQVYNIWWQGEEEMAETNKGTRQEFVVFCLLVLFCHERGC